MCQHNILCTIEHRLRNLPSIANSTSKLISNLTNNYRSKVFTKAEIDITL